MSNNSPRIKKMAQRNISDRTYTEADMQKLRYRLQEAEDTLEAIREGAVDAVVVKAKDSQQIFTLKSADHAYRVLIESMNQGALTISDKGIILYSNSQFSQMTGQPLNKIIGSNFEKFFMEGDRPLLAGFLARRVLDSGPAESITLALGSKTYRAVMLSATGLQTHEDNTYMCVVVTDMTEIKRASDAKDEFISLASHQLRTPATGVKQYLGMVLENYTGDISDQQRTYLQTAYDSNERQISIIQDILKTARIDSGVFKLERVHTDIADLVAMVAEDYSAIFSMRHQKLITSFEDDLYVLVDPAEISLVISNLLENASKYSPEGTSIAVKGIKKGSKLILSITDSGVGINAKDTGRIFDKFTRVSNTMSDTVSGNGLGLYWVMRIVTLHGGSIKVESVFNEGSTFTVILPIES
ncbi:MAG: putative histidine kinase [Marmoricola sp.]|nr:putative histidine kinase [Marmoricola sp.]